MNVYYSDMELPKKFGKSIFLAGPSPRDPDVESWRPKAIDILESIGYDGEVYIPERKGGWDGVDYIEQIEWEHSALESVDIVMFWVPRDIDAGMPAFTTNVEFGTYCSKGSIVYGRPVDSDKNRYLDHMYLKYQGHPPKDTLFDTVSASADFANSEEEGRQWARERHCCGSMVYACREGIIDYDMSNEKYHLPDVPPELIIRSCPWCGYNLAILRSDLMDGTECGTMKARLPKPRRKRPKTK